MEYMEQGTDKSTQPIINNPVEVINDIMKNYFAEFSFSSNQETTKINGAGTYERINAGTAGYLINMLGFSFSDNKLTYLGDSVKFNCSLLALISMGSSEEREIRITIYKNGLPIRNGYGKILVAGNSSNKAVSFSTELDLDKGDTIEARIANAGGTEEITVINQKFSIVVQQ